MEIAKKSAVAKIARISPYPNRQAINLTPITRRARSVIRSFQIIRQAMSTKMPILRQGAFPSRSLATIANIPIAYVASGMALSINCPSSEN